MKKIYSVASVTKIKIAIEVKNSAVTHTELTTTTKFGTVKSVKICRLKYFPYINKN